MTAEEKSVLSLFMIGVLIVVGKVLAGGEPITPRLFIGRMLLGGFVSMVAGVVLVQFPDLSLPAVCGIGSMLGIAGYQVIEIAIQRRFKGRETVMPVINTHQNIAAFLDMLVVSEGTANHPLTKNRGYDVIVTGLDGKPEIFTDYSDHPFAHGRPARCLTVAVKNPRHPVAISSFTCSGTTANSLPCRISVRCHRTDSPFS